MNARPIVLDRAQLYGAQNTEDGENRRNREWWAQSTAEEIQAEAAKMAKGELDALVGELNAAISSTATVVNDPQMTDTVWKDRARRALTHQRKARSLVAAEAGKRQDESARYKREERKRIVAQARDCVADNNLPGAVMLMLTWIEGFGQKDPEPVRTSHEKAEVQRG